MTKKLVAEREFDTDPHQTCELDSVMRLVSLLRSESVRVVFAESCTAGWAAAALGAVPGISEHFCGSVVAYRDQTKIDLLGVQDVGLKLWTSVSAPIAAQMARNVLLQTTEADFAASITGHLGPDLPKGHQAEVFLGLAWRAQGVVTLYQVVHRSLDERTRLARRDEATESLFHHLADCIEAIHA